MSVFYVGQKVIIPSKAEMKSKIGYDLRSWANPYYDKIMTIISIDESHIGLKESRGFAWKKEWVVPANTFTISQELFEI